MKENIDSMQTEDVELIKQQLIQRLMLSKSNPISQKLLMLLTNKKNISVNKIFEEYIKASIKISILSYITPNILAFYEHVNNTYKDIHIFCKHEKIKERNKETNNDTKNINIEILLQHLKKEVCQMIINNTDNLKYITQVEQVMISDRIKFFIDMN